MPFRYLQPRRRRWQPGPRRL